MLPRHYPESAIDSPASHVASEYKKHIANIRGLTVELSEHNRPEIVRPLNKWCVQSGSAVEQGGAPDWEELYQILQDAPEILSLARQKCSEFNNFVAKLELGLVGERTNENDFQNPLSSRDSGQHVVKIDQLMTAATSAVADVDPQYVTRTLPSTAQTAGSSAPPVSRVRKSALAQAVIASSRVSTSAKVGSNKS